MKLIKEKMMKNGDRKDNGITEKKKKENDKKKT